MIKKSLFMIATVAVTLCLLFCGAAFGAAEGEQQKSVRIETDSTLHWKDFTRGLFDGETPTDGGAIMSFSNSSMILTYYNGTGLNLSVLEQKNIVLSFWLYINDTSALGGDNPKCLQLCSSTTGVQDDGNCYRWILGTEFYNRFTDGKWNKVELKLPAAGFNDLCSSAFYNKGATSCEETGDACYNGQVDLSNVTYLRMYDLFTSNETVYFLLSDMQFIEQTPEEWKEETSLTRIAETRDISKIPDQNSLKIEHNVKTDVFSNFYDQSGAPASRAEGKVNTRLPDPKRVSASAGETRSKEIAMYAVGGAACAAGIAFAAIGVLIYKKKR